jgi:hypothetical protein
MAGWDMRVDVDMRYTVNRAMDLVHSKGPSAASSFLYRFGVPGQVIERVIGPHAKAFLTRKCDRSSPRPILLSDVLATDELTFRQGPLPASPLEQCVEWPPARPTLYGLLASVRGGVGAGSVGVSLFDSTMDELTWIAICGDLVAFEGRRFPRRHSMCDVAFQTLHAQLFVQPHLYYEWMAQNGIFVDEALITPLILDHDRFLGTLWAVKQTDFGAEFSAAHLGMLQLHALAIATLVPH